MAVTNTSECNKRPGRICFSLKLSADILCLQLAINAININQLNHSGDEMLKIILSILFIIFALSRIKSIWRVVRGEDVPTMRGQSINYNRKDTSRIGPKNLPVAGAIAAGAAGAAVISEFASISNGNEFGEASDTNDIDVIADYSGPEIEINPSTGFPMLDDSIDVLGNAYGFDDSMDMHSDLLSTNNDIPDIDDGFGNSFVEFDDSFSSFDDSFSSFDDF